MDLKSYLNKTFTGFNPADFPAGTKIHTGKVRDIITLDGKLLITTSDRISAFDRVLSTIPCKGELLNRMALFWFDQTKDIIPNHIIKKVSARTILVKQCRVLPVEVIVRGYLTGSAWRDYQAGKAISGIRLPEGMKCDQKFEKPLLTPSTKAEMGLHDEPISREEILERKLVPADVWEKVEKAAFALFERGTEIAARNGLILVDTKYEFGIDADGNVVLVDEVHTPDSSRYWYADTYREYFEAGKSQRKVDKEFLRQWLMDRGFMGDGESPEIPDEIRIAVAEKYINAFETVTGMTFKPESLSPEEETEAVKKEL